MRIQTMALWFELMIATAVLAATCTLAAAPTGRRCKTTPCTYFAQGKPHEGTCGTRKHDKTNCWCIENADKKKAEIQSGCSLPSEN